MSHYVDEHRRAGPQGQGRGVQARWRKNRSAQVWKEHGALQYWECIGDDVQPGKNTSFPAGACS